MASELPVSQVHTKAGGCLLLQLSPYSSAASPLHLASVTDSQYCSFVHSDLFHSTLR